MHDFDTVIDRGDTFSTKWNKYAGTKVLPFWVADMDFASPDFVLDAIRQRLNHGILGYTDTPAPALAAFLSWLERWYDWQVDPDWLVWLPGVVGGMNLAGRAVGDPGDEIIVPTPVYHPFLDIAANSNKTAQFVAMAPVHGRWRLDLEALETSIQATTRGIFICNPQNPTGRVYSRDELAGLARLCEQYDLILVSDEIHCQLIIDERRHHTPVASLSDAIRERSITLFSPNKTYNIAGLGCAVAVIPNIRLREKFRAARRGMIGGISPLAFAAVTAAFNDASDWLASLNRYLAGNHALLTEAVAMMPGVEATKVEGTYLAWLDLNALGLDDPEQHLRDHGVGVSNGAQFGAPGYVRFNFACPRVLLQEGIQRLRHALGPR